MTKVSVRVQDRMFETLVLPKDDGVVVGVASKVGQ